MKKVIKPKEEEEAAYYSDFTGKPLGALYGAEVELIMSFSYGSKYDGSDFKLHLSDEDAEEILLFLASKISSDCKKEIQKNLQQFDERYDDAMDSRAWGDCEYIHNNREVLKKLLNLDK
jgi:hypothetical protein